MGSEGQDIMVRPDLAQPTAEAVGMLLSKVPEKYIERWYGYNPSNSKQALYPRKGNTDTKIHYSRKDDWKARIALFNIQQTGIKDLVYHEPTVLRSTPRSAVGSTIDNLEGTSSKDQTISKSIEVGKSELDEVKAGFSVASKTTIGTGEGASVKVEQEIETTITSEWSKQTGKTETDTTSVDDVTTVDPGTKVQTFFTWDEQDLKRHIEGYAILNCGIQIGKRSTEHGRGWHWYADKKWDSIDELVAVVKGNGSTKSDLYSWFYDKSHMPNQTWIDTVDNRIAIKMDFFVEYKGAVSLTSGVKMITDERKERGLLP